MLLGLFYLRNADYTYTVKLNVIPAQENSTQNNLQSFQALDH